MSSILNTDLGDLFDQWGQRVAFNEGYQKQKIDEANQAGREAYHLGIDRIQGREIYFETKDQKFDGEETLGMESVVANETEDAFNVYTDGGLFTQDEIDSVWDEAAQMDLNFDANGYETYEQWAIAEGEFA